MTMFEQKLNDWLIDNGFVCNVEFNEVFGYGIESKTLYVGTQEFANAGVWYEQFLYEYGLEYTGIYTPVLCLLHELGHNQTIYDFNKSELDVFFFIKDMMEEECQSDQQEMFKYWEIPDEFAANMWAIKFINTNINCVCELCEIYRLYWNNFIAERKCA